MKPLLIIILVFQVFQSFPQQRTVGLFLNDTANACEGYTLFAPKHNTMTYLINNNGEKVHEWNNCTYNPGQAVYLLENGNLLRTCSVLIPGGLALGGGEGGRLEEYTWNDSLIWHYNYVTANYTQHHDVKRLPNGNIIMLVAEKKIMTEIQAAGFDPSKLSPDIINKGYMAPNCVIEIHPILPDSAVVVWEWHVWDHLIQDYDPSKNNYGVVNQHPELVDCDGDHRMLPLFWNHMNSIDYNPAFDEIALSVRGNSEVWIIDHSTTTAQSAGHSGGIHGKGGDLLYRWGNPLTYGRGTNANQIYDEQHDVEWVHPDCPGAGNLTCFNNGIIWGYSSVDEITPPVDANGNYTLAAGAAYGPAALTWRYTATPPASLYASDISGAQRLQNGNTLIDNGPKGTFLEVTPQGLLVWKYINPTVTTGPLCIYDSIPHDPTHPQETLNSVFRIYRYPPGYAAFTGKDLTPQGPIECFPVGLQETSPEGNSSFVLYQSSPNPATGMVAIEFRLSFSSHVSLKVYDVFGREISVLADENLTSGKYRKTFDASNLHEGIYFYTLTTGNSSETRKMMIAR